MAETKAPETASRRIPVIVFERPPLDWGRFVLGIALGLVAGAALGLLQWLLASRGGGGIGPEWLLAPTARYTWPLAFVGVLAGLAFGWTWKREQQARIELVEMAPTVRQRARRRRVSTELESYWRS
jgi:hypothetical protein